MGSRSFSSKRPYKEHLVRDGGGLAGEVLDLRTDVEEAFVSSEKLENGTNALVLEEWTPPLKVGNYFMASTAFTASAQGIKGAGVTGAVAAPPRNIILGVTIATGTGAGTVTIIGTDVHGTALTEAFIIPAASGSVVGLKAFATVTEVDLPAHGGAFTGTAIVGTGDKIGFGEKAKTRASGVMVIQEVYDGARVTNGVFAVATVGLPHGTYAPNTPPDGTHKYAVIFERDPS